MDRKTKAAIVGVMRTLAGLITSEPKKPAKPKPAPAAPRELTELERVQRDFAFQREHGGILAEGRINEWGQVDWRFRR